jgi:hypothetical protein
MRVSVAHSAMQMAVQHSVQVNTLPEMRQPAAAEEVEPYAGQRSSPAFPNFSSEDIGHTDATSI